MSSCSECPFESHFSHSATISEIQLRACLSSSFNFHRWVVVHCVDPTQFVYPSIHWRTSGLFPLLCDCVLSCSKRSWTGVFVNLNFLFSTVNAQQWDCWVRWCMFNFVRNGQTVFQGGCTIFHSHKRSMRTPVVLHSCKISCYHSLFDFSYSSAYSIG